MVPPLCAGGGIFLLAALGGERAQDHKLLRHQGPETCAMLRSQEAAGHGDVVLRAALSGPTEVDNVFEECCGGAHW